MRYLLLCLVMGLIGCSDSPTAPTNKTGMSGDWSGTLGTLATTLRLQQDGEALGGTIAAWGSIGTFSGVLKYSMVTFTLHLPGLCPVTLHGYASASPDQISGDYSGTDCAAGPLRGRLEIRKR